jgi:hypothetical protein
MWWNFPWKKSQGNYTPFEWLQSEEDDKSQFMGLLRDIPQVYYSH